MEYSVQFIDNLVGVGVVVVIFIFIFLTLFPSFEMLRGTDPKSAARALRLRANRLPAS